MVESVFDWQSYMKGGITEMATKLKDGASTATVLEMASKRREIAQMALVSHDTEAEQGWWVSKTEGIAFKLASLYGAALTLDL